MPDEVIVSLMREGMYLIVLISTLIILPSLIVGLIVSIFQAATQINEQTLSFLPRLLTTMLAIMLMGQWIASHVTEFVQKVIASIPYVLG
jgi:flagellar biosynthetic protein FliQ